MNAKEKQTFRGGGIAAFVSPSRSIKIQNVFLVFASSLTDEPETGELSEELPGIVATLSPADCKV